MLDHVTIGVTDLAGARAFYDAALRPLGLAVVMEVPGRFVGYGQSKPYFWIGLREGAQSSVHIAFAAADHAAVRAFHAAALAAGGRDNGPPGLRLHYHPHYYAAFVLDPDGHNIEAVCHAPAGAGPAQG
jgi:catechol 2,3-dioxygenase-like lactoylglutathione lyase family enzyme